MIEIIDKETIAIDGAHCWAPQEAVAEIKNLRAFAQFIIDGYANQDLNHLDFRVGAYKNALLALDRPVPLLAGWDEYCKEHGHPSPKTECTAYLINGCAHPQFCKDGCAGKPYTLEKEAHPETVPVDPDEKSQPKRGVQDETVPGYLPKP